MLIHLIWGIPHWTNAFTAVQEQFAFHLIAQQDGLHDDINCDFVQQAQKTILIHQCCEKIGLDPQVLLCIPEGPDDFGIKNLVRPELRNKVGAGHIISWQIIFLLLSKTQNIQLLSSDGTDLLKGYDANNTAPDLEIAYQQYNEFVFEFYLYYNRLILRLLSGISYYMPQLIDDKKILNYFYQDFLEIEQSYNLVHTEKTFLTPQQHMPLLSARVYHFAARVYSCLTAFIKIFERYLETHQFKTQFIHFKNLTNPASRELIDDVNVLQFAFSLNKQLKTIDFILSAKPDLVSKGSFAISHQDWMTMLQDLNFKKLLQIHLIKIINNKEFPIKEFGIFIEKNGDLTFKVYEIDENYKIKDIVWNSLSILKKTWLLYDKEQNIVIPLICFQPDFLKFFVQSSHIERCPIQEEQPSVLQFVITRKVEYLENWVKHSAPLVNMAYLMRSYGKLWRIDANNVYQHSICKCMVAVFIKMCCAIMNQSDCVKARLLITQDLTPSKHKKKQSPEDEIKVLPQLQDLPAPQLPKPKKDTQNPCHNWANEYEKIIQDENKKRSGIISDENYCFNMLKKRQDKERKKNNNINTLQQKKDKKTALKVQENLLQLCAAEKKERQSILNDMHNAFTALYRNKPKMIKKQTIHRAPQKIVPTTPNKSISPCQKNDSDPQADFRLRIAQNMQNTLESQINQWLNTHVGQNENWYNQYVGLLDKFKTEEKQARQNLIFHIYPLPNKKQKEIIKIISQYQSKQNLKRKELSLNTQDIINKLTTYIFGDHIKFMPLGSLMRQNMTMQSDIEGFLWWDTQEQWPTMTEQLKNQMILFHQLLFSKDRCHLKKDQEGIFPNTTGQSLPPIITPFILNGLLNCGIQNQCNWTDPFFQQLNQYNDYYKILSFKINNSIIPYTSSTFRLRQMLGNFIRMLFCPDYIGLFAHDALIQKGPQILAHKEKLFESYKQKHHQDANFMRRCQTIEPEIDAIKVYLKKLVEDLVEPWGVEPQTSTMPS